MIKKLMKVVAVVVLLVFVGGGGFVFMKTSAFDGERAKVWDVPLAQVKAPDLTAAAAAIAHPVAPAADAELAKSIAIYTRGEHLAKSIGACNDCHGENYATPRMIEMGPIGEMVAPNVTMGGRLKDYSDGQFHRLLTHGIKADGTTLTFMPSADFRWWPDDDIMALLGYLRVQPVAATTTAPLKVGVLGKVLDQTDKLPLLIAKRIANTPRNVAPPPSESAEYGKHLGGLCQGCHGVTLSGGPIPGAPPELAVPLNITMHETGIKHYDFAKFDTLMRTAVKADGKPLDPFMPVGTLKNMSETEMKALWAYIQTVEPKPFGGR